MFHSPEGRGGAGRRHRGHLFCFFFPSAAASFRPFVFRLEAPGGSLRGFIYMQRRRQPGKTTHQNFETGDADASARQDGEYAGEPSSNRAANAAWAQVGSSAPSSQTRPLRCRRRFPFGQRGSRSEGGAETPPRGRRSSRRVGWEWANQLSRLVPTPNIYSGLSWFIPGSCGAGQLRPGRAEADVRRGNLRRFHAASSSSNQTQPSSAFIS